MASIESELDDVSIETQAFLVSSGAAVTTAAIAGLTLGGVA